MNKLFAVVVVVVVCAGCPIDGTRDGIGAPCTVDGDPCPLDHTCLPADASDPAEGTCAPILDYGSCDAPAYAQKAGKVLDEDLDVDDGADLGKLEGVISVTGELRFEAPGAGGLLELGDLCDTRGLQRVEGKLLISELDVETLDGLQGLAVAKGGVLVHAMGSLVDVLALQNLVTATPFEGRDFGVGIANNRALDEPAIQALKDALAERSPTVKVFACGNKNSPAALQTCPNLNDLLAP
ncbi:MAG: hypothetical protein Q8O67_24150 [Deltaproteobacteria bacterium]|nr:hypothetical protein [Deltaproteobacteria bacterium]